MAKSSSLSLLEALDTLSTFSSASSIQDIALCEDFDLNIDGLELHVSSLKALACDLSQKELEHVVHNTLLVVSDHLKEASKMQKRSAQLHLKVSRTTANVMQLSTEALNNLGQILSQEVGEHLQKSEAMTQVSQLHRKVFGERKVMPLARKNSSGRVRPQVSGLYEMGQKELGSLLHHLEYLFEDTLYELYFLQKASGPFWLDQELIHHMQAYEDFHELLASHSKHDPLYQALCHIYTMKARFVWSECETELDEFLKSSVNTNDYPLSNHVRKALVALKLAAFMHEEGSDVTSEKQSYHYGSDFLLFLRDALNDDLWKKIAHECRGHDKSTKWTPLYNLVNAWLETSLQFDEMKVAKEALAQVPVAVEASIEGIWGLDLMSQALRLFVEKKTMGVFQRSLEQVQIFRRYYGFDPHLMGHSPCPLHGLYFKGQKITQWLMAAPIHQTQVEKASIAPEWSKKYVEKNLLKNERALWVDLEAPHSWLDQARTQAVAAWAHEEGLYLKSLPLNGVAISAQGDSALFIQSLKQSLVDSCGDFSLVQGQQVNLDALILVVWRNFFGMKNRLTQAEERAFSDMVSLMLLLVAFERSEKTSLVYLSKDGLDGSLFMGAALMMLAKLYQEGKWTKEDLEELMAFIHSRPLIFRCRLFLADHLQRLCSLLAAFEEMATVYGHEAFVRAIDGCYQSLGREGALGLSWRS